MKITGVICWYLGCNLDYSAGLQNGCDAIPCRRCGANDTTYSDRCGDTRHNRAKDLFSWWLWRRWLQRRCKECGARFGCRADCDAPPF